MRFYYDRHELETLLGQARRNFRTKEKLFNQSKERWAEKHKNIMKDLDSYNFAVFRNRNGDHLPDLLGLKDTLIDSGLVVYARDLHYDERHDKYPMLEPAEPYPQKPKDFIAPPKVPMTGRETQIALSMVENEILIGALKDAE